MTARPLDSRAILSSLAIVVGLAACTSEPEIADENLVVTEAPLFADWDADSDGTISRAEFARELEPLLAEWDDDGDGSLGREEFTAVFNESTFDFGDRSSFEAWDANDDDVLDLPEIADGIFDAWDVDDDDVLDKVEFGADDSAGTA